MLRSMTGKTRLGFEGSAPSGSGPALVDREAGSTRLSQAPTIALPPRPGRVTPADLPSSAGEPPVAVPRRSGRLSVAAAVLVGGAAFVLMGLGVKLGSRTPSNERSAPSPPATAASIPARPPAPPRPDAPAEPAPVVIHPAASASAKAGATKIRRRPTKISRPPKATRASRAHKMKNVPLIADPDAPLDLSM